ncbi:MAG: hypothetical protein K8T26_03545 [Lentisphaerae bacterium]|nr:hypothetical protein [Lentisphaerota bacterium]
MIDLLNRALNAGVGLLLAPLRDRSPWLAMILLAAVAAVIVLVIVRLCASPSRIRRRKNRVLARIMELAIYQDDPLVTLSAVGRALAANVCYLITLLPAVAASLLPLLLVLVQVHAWLGLRPLLTGEACLVTARLAPGLSVVTAPVELLASTGLTVETPGVRLPSANEISWRIRAVNPSRAEWVDVVVGDQSLRAAVAAGPGLQAKSERRPGASWLSQLAHPAAPPLPANGPVQTIDIHYPAYAFAVSGHAWHWLLVFTVLSLLIAWPLQRPFGVVM